MRDLFVDSMIWDPEARPGKGPLPADYAIVGIAPSTKRPIGRDNEPFGAKSWSLIKAIKEDSEGTIYVTNLIKAPLEPGTTPNVRQVRRALPSLMAELKMVQAKRILCVGGPPASVLCGPGFTNVSDDHGTLFFNDELNAYVVPTYHFSAIARNPGLQSILARDLERFFELPDPVPPQFHVYEAGQNYYFPEGSRVFLDIETTGLDPRSCDIISIGLYAEDWDGKVLIIPHPTSHMLNHLLSKLKEKNCILVGHNMQFDLYFLGEKSGKFWDLPIEDTMLMAHIAGEEKLSLKHLTTRYTDRPGPRAYGSFNDYEYLAEDVLSTYEIYDYFKPSVQDAFITGVLNDLVPVTVGMRLKGVYIDRPKLRVVLDEWDSQSMAHLVGLGESINWNSTQQVAEELIRQGVHLTKKTKGGGWAVSEDVLEELATDYDIARQILEYRYVIKQRTFLENYLNDTSDAHPFLHPRLLLSGTRTGRLACQNPNLQQVPRVGPIKTIFRSRWDRGHIGLIDLSQAELRVTAYTAEDEAFAAMLLSGDAHRSIAARLWGIPEDQVTSAQRKASKAITFGLLYGGSPKGLAKRVGVSEREVTKILQEFFSAFPKLSTWLENTKKLGVKMGYVVTPFGRVRDLTGLIREEGDFSAQRKAVNTPIQATASDITLLILRYVSGALRQQGLRSRPIITVHDSELIDVYPREEEAVGAIVQEGFRQLWNSPLGSNPLFHTLPLVGELVIAESWAAVESTNEGYNPKWKFDCSSERI